MMEIGKKVSKATPPAVPEDAERACEDDGTYKPDDKTTDDKNEAYEPSSIETDDESSTEPSTQAPSQGFGDVGLGGFGDTSLGGFGDTFWAVQPQTKPKAKSLLPKQRKPKWKSNRVKAHIIALKQTQ